MNSNSKQDIITILNLISVKYPDVTPEDLKKSYEVYSRMLHFININFHMYHTRGCKFLCDMHEVKEYDEYIRFLDKSGIEYRF